MEILNSLKNQRLKVFVTNSSTGEDAYLEGILKDVDSDGILLLTGESDYSSLDYIKHYDYNQIRVVKEEQSKSGILNAFRQKQSSLWSFDEE